jgi:TRAP-type C4-dicarboxylate transport system permease small subunit
MLRRLYALMDRVGEVLAFAGMILISVAIAASMVDIVGRKTIGFSVLGIDDITQLLVMSCICLSMPLTYIREGHVGVDFITDGLPPRALALLKFLVALLATAFVAMLVWYAWGQARQQIEQGNKSITLAIPIAYYWAPLLIGMAGSTIASLLLTLRFAIVALGGCDVAPARALTTEER